MLLSPLDRVHPLRRWHLRLEHMPRHQRASKLIVHLEWRPKWGSSSPCRLHTYAPCRPENRHCSIGGGQNLHPWLRLLIRRSTLREAISMTHVVDNYGLELEHLRPIVLPRYVLVSLGSFVPSRIQPSNPLIWKSMNIMREDD